MKRVLIVDDDFLVCRFLEQIIDWRAQGYELVGIARDGSQALKMISEKKPDILITDIEMPVMDGIQLVKQVRSTGNPVKILILSCYDDIVHVKEGIRAGADEYYLKDELTDRSLLELLDRFSDEMLPAQTGSEEEEKRKRLETEERHLQQLLDGTIPDMAGKGRRYLFAVHVTEKEEQRLFGTTEQRERFCNAFREMMRTQVSDCAEAQVCHVRGGWFALLLEGAEAPGLQEQRYRMQELANRLLYQGERAFDLQVQIGIAEQETGIQETTAVWELAKGLTGHGFYERTAVFTSWQYPGMGSTLPGCGAVFLEEAEGWRVKGRGEEIRLAVQEVLESFEREKTKEAVVFSWVRSADSIFRIGARSFPARFKDLENLGKEYQRACTEQAADPCLYSEHVSGVIRFIRENYRNNITLNAAAEEVHLTPTYLSYIFHKETGATFSEYLQNCRLDHAKELLAETGEKIREIGETVGYHDYRHFCKTFKKAEGITPQEYRKRKRR
ncbi:MAG: response regulator [Lachnospiraceae bacterium]|nr:response regulator [Lachnospiraceae bacterium]